MLVFIDDSGDAGFNIEKGVSKVFVIACIIFEDDLEAEKSAVAIKELKRKLGFPDKVEFKFNKSSRKTRMEFLECVTKFKFKIRCLTVKKEAIRSEELKKDRNSFYGYTIKLLLQHSGDSILDAKIRIDGGGDRIFRRNFVVYLRKQLNSEHKKVMKDCKFIDSKENVLIQMADMVVGSIRRSYDTEKTDHLIYKSVINRHIEDEWLFK